MKVYIPRESLFRLDLLTITLALTIIFMSNNSYASLDNSNIVDIDFEIGEFNKSISNTRRSQTNKYKVASTTTGTDKRIEGGISDVLLYEEDDSRDFYDVVFRSFDVGRWSNKLNSETTVLDEVFFNVIEPSSLRKIPKTEIALLADKLASTKDFTAAVKQYKKKADIDISFDMRAYDFHIMKLITNLQSFVKDTYPNINNLPSTSNNTRRASLSDDHYFLIDPAFDAGFLNNLVQRQSIGIKYRDHSTTGFPDGEARYYLFNDSSLVYGIVSKDSFDMNEGLFLGTNIIEPNIGFLATPSSLLDATCNVIDSLAASPNGDGKKTVMTEQEFDESLYQSRQNGDASEIYEGVLYTSFSKWSTPTFLNYMNLIGAVADVTGGGAQVITNVLKKKKNRFIIEDTYAALNKVSEHYKKNERLVKAIVGATTLMESLRRIAEVPTAFVSTFQYEQIVSYNQTMDNTFTTIDSVLSNVRNIVNWVDQNDLWKEDDFKFNPQGIVGSKNFIDWLIAWGKDVDEAEAWLFSQLGLKGANTSLPLGVEINSLNRIPVAMKKFRKLIQDLGARKTNMSTESFIEGTLYVLKTVFDIAANDECLLKMYPGDTKFNGSAIKDHLTKFKGLPLIKLITGINSGAGMAISYATMPSKVGFKIQYKDGVENPPHISVNFDKKIDYTYKKFSAFHKQKVLFEKGNVSLVEQGYQYTPKITAGIFTKEDEDFLDDEYLPNISADTDVIGLKWSVLRSGEAFNENPREVSFEKQYLDFHKYDLYDDPTGIVTWLDWYEGDKNIGQDALKIISDKYQLKNEDGTPAVYLNSDGLLQATSALNDTKYETFEFTDVMKLFIGKQYGLLSASENSVNSGTAVSMFTPGAYVNTLSIDMYTKDNEIGTGIEITERMYVLQRFLPEVIEAAKEYAHLINYNDNSPYISFRINNANDLIKYHRDISGTPNNDTGLYLYIVDSSSFDLLASIPLTLNFRDRIVQGNISKDFLDTSKEPYQIKDNYRLVLAEGTLELFMEDTLNSENIDGLSVIKTFMYNKIRDAHLSIGERDSAIIFDNDSLPVQHVAEVEDDATDETVIIPIDDTVLSSCSSGTVPEADSGFTYPISDSFINNGGYYFEQEAHYNNGTVYHPGEDWNVPSSPGGSCDGDKGLDVIAVADGLVVDSNTNSWGGLVIQHNYDGETWYSQYGHIQNILVTKGEQVTQGQKIAEIGDVGTTCAHLHFEIRTEQHPAPCNAAYWSYGDTGLYNLANVSSWYESPYEFIPNHSAYEKVSPIIIHVIDENSGILQIEAQEIIKSADAKINDQIFDGVWSEGKLTLDLGMSLRTLEVPLKINLINDDGNESYVCFPFKDVCPDYWYSTPIMTLWRYRILEGYADGTVGTFKPSNSATRAEFISALVRAIEFRTINSGNEPEPLTTPPFNDVGINDWYSTFVAYAKQIGLIEGCDPTANLFCPMDNISRAAAIKVVAQGLLQSALTSFENGQPPLWLYPDVTEPTDWFYAPIYAAQIEGVAHGLPDGLFHPENDLSRAAMAKIICVARFGLSDCGSVADMDKPLVVSVQPTIANLNEATTFTITGHHLPDTLVFWGDGCAQMEDLDGDTREQHQFRCVPESEGVKDAVVKDQSGGQALKNFVVDVQGDEVVPPPPPTCEGQAPTVDSVLPLTATLNQSTTFTVTGSCLPESLAFWIDECTNMTALNSSDTERRFSCTPSFKTGSHAGEVKDAPNGNLLKPFSVNFTDSSTPCSPSVSSVTPSSAQLDSATVFTVSGQCLPDSTALWIDECTGMLSLGGSAVERRFECTPSYKTGSHSGEVKNLADDAVLKPFSVNFTETGTPCTPSVSSVTPSSAELNAATVFTVSGQCLPDSTALWIDECTGMQALGGSDVERHFECTPSYKTGSHTGEVKNLADDAVLKPFSVDFTETVAPPCTPEVDSLSPLSVTIDEPETFTVKGRCLPDTTALWIDECEYMQGLGGSDTERQFRCTPMSSPGTKKSEVKDKPDGTLLNDFTVEVNMGSPRVESVTPTSANLWESTHFKVEGTSLTKDIVFWIAECENMEWLGGLAEYQDFRCTPSHTTGVKDGLVKNADKSVTLKSFSVNVQ